VTGRKKKHRVAQSFKRNRKKLKNQVPLIRKGKKKSAIAPRGTAMKLKDETGAEGKRSCLNHQSREGEDITFEFYAKKRRRTKAGRSGESQEEKTGIKAREKPYISPQGGPIHLRDTVEEEKEPPPYPAAEEETFYQFKKRKKRCLIDTRKSRDTHSAEREAIFSRETGTCIGSGKNAARSGKSVREGEKGMRGKRNRLSGEEETGLKK